VRRDGYVLVDGGAMNKIPADVVKAMGATKVVAVNVGDLTDRGEVNESMFGLAGSTIDAMMRANTRVGIRQADVIINVPLADYGSLDWRRSTDLINEGYKAAESMKDSLLPLAVNETEYAAWKAARQARVKTALPPPAFVRVEGFSSGDTRSVDKLLEHHVGQPFDVEALQTELSALSGLDRYQSVTWSLVPGASGETGLLVQAHPKTYAPPFLMLGINLENTTSDSFNLSVGARYLGYDMVGPRSELRVDGTVGSDPALGIELYKPIGPGAFFVAPFAGITNRTHNVVVENEVVASYGSTLSAVGLNLGLNLGRISDLRVGAHVGRLSADVKVGDPGLPAIKGSQTVAEAAWRYNSLDSPAVPSLGSYARATLRYVFDGPDIDPPLQTGRSSVKLTQLFGEDVTFWTWRNRHRLFALGGGGTSFNDEPLPTDQFALGAPFHLGAYGFGEIRGDHYYVLTLGYLRQLGRLPDFLGGTISAGGWLENGDAFNSWDDVGIRTHASAGVIMDTLIGPVILAGSAGFDGRFRFYLGVGRIYGGNR
jgi:NTE family protein